MKPNVIPKKGDTTHVDLSTTGYFEVYVNDDHSSAIASAVA